MLIIRETMCEFYGNFSMLFAQLFCKSKTVLKLMKKWIKDLNVRPKLISLKKTGTNICGLGLDILL